MKQGTKLRLQASADSMLHNAGAALGSVAYYVLSPIAAPVMTALHVKHVKNKAIQENKDFSTKKQLVYGTRTFFESFYHLPRGLFRMAQESVKESHDSRVAAYKLEHKQKLSEHIQYLESTGVADLLKLIRGHYVECRDVNFIVTIEDIIKSTSRVKELFGLYNKDWGNIVTKKCWCFDRFVVYMDKKAKRCCVYEQKKAKRCCVYEQALSDDAIDAHKCLVVPSDLFDRVYDALTSHVAYQERMLRLAVEENKQKVHEKVVAERMAREREIQQGFKNKLADSVSQLQK